MQLGAVIKSIKLIQQDALIVVRKVLSNFLHRLQYIGFTHRSRLWHRALELCIVAETPIADESPDSPLCQPCRVPTAMRSC